MASLRPGDDASEVLADHGGDVLHGLDLRMHDAGPPVSEHVAHDVDLFALEDLAARRAVAAKAVCCAIEKTDGISGRLVRMTA